MKKISLLVPAETIASCVTGTFEVFEKVNSYLAQDPHPLRSRLDVELVGIGSRSVSAGFLRFDCNTTYREIERTDLILIPPLVGPIPELVEKYRDVVDWIRMRYQDGHTEIGSLCTGAFLLGATGLVDGKACSTHWIAADLFRSMFPRVNLLSHRIITDEDRIYTSGGALSFYNLILYIVEKYCGKEIALRAAKMFLVDLDRTSQAHFSMFNPQKKHRDEQIIRAQEFLEQNYEREIGVDEVACMIGLSRRNFVRRFKKATDNTPIEYLQRVRIEAAKKALEMTADPISEVMYSVGYSDVKSFRELFKKITGVPPTAYRKKYSSAV